MSFSNGVLKNDEKAIYSLRALYKQYGYSLYKVSKFEEYDLYAGNKSFLVSQNILTFTDTNGKLLALKPDVTLSIIKNIPDEDLSVHKLCYDENVYRTSSAGDGFREIMQTGLECIGTIDRHAECEVILLAMQSLNTISSDYLLDVSHMGILDGLLDEAGVLGSDRDAFFPLIESKNVNALAVLCDKKGVASALSEKLCAITELYLPIQEALPVLKELIVGEKMQQAYESLCGILKVLQSQRAEARLYLDFSLVNDVNYYDGISFKGFINGIPESVLSGGRYDRLLQRLGKKAGAIGFAVYLDRLERFENEVAPYDVDVVLQYDDGIDVQSVFNAQKKLMEEEKQVMVTVNPDPSLRYRQLIKLTRGGMDILETHD